MLVGAEGAKDKFCPKCTCTKGAGENFRRPKAQEKVSPITYFWGGGSKGGGWVWGTLAPRLALSC